MIQFPIKGGGNLSRKGASKGAVEMSKKVRELVDLGRVMLAIEKYRKSEASLEKAARIAGVSISKMIDVLRDHGVEANLEYEDYLKGLKSLRKIW